MFWMYACCNFTDMFAKRATLNLIRIINLKIRAMEKKANEAQRFLLDNDCGDLVLNERRTNWIYASDIMMKFWEHMKSSASTTSIEESVLPISDVRLSLPISVNQGSELYAKKLREHYDKEIQDELKYIDGFQDAIRAINELA